MPRRLSNSWLAIRLILAAVGMGVVVMALIGYATWRSIERVTVAASPATGEEAATGTGLLHTADGSIPDVMLLVGSDSRQGLSNLQNFGEFEGARADVIIATLRRDDQTTLLSIPRDLYVDDGCGGGKHRIGDALAGCDGQNGLSNLVDEAERLLGVPIDHAVLVDLAGFQAIVDGLDGYEICVQNPMRDLKSGLDLGSGCTVADGAQTLAWLRSRQTEELVDGEWRTVEGVSDLERNRRQRLFLQDLIGRLGSVRNPARLLLMTRGIAPFLVMDSQLALADAAGWAWDLRGGEVTHAEIPVEYHTTESGQSVLVPTGDVTVLVDSILS